MDALDTKILQQLTRDARISTTQLAKQARVSREVVDYRIRKLEEDQIIRGYYAKINARRLGFERYQVFIQLKKASHEQEQGILSRIGTHRAVSTLGPVTGTWSLVGDFFARDTRQLLTIHEELIVTCGEYLDNMTIRGPGTSSHIYETKIVDAKRPPPTQSNKAHNIDETDQHLLKLLSTNARRSNSALGKHVNLSYGAVRNRIERLESAGIVTSYTCDVDFRKLGYELYNIQVQTTPQTRKSISAFFSEHESVFYVYNYIGRGDWDSDIGVLVDNHQQLHEFIRELKQTFPTTLQVTNMYVVPELRISNAAPECLFT